MDHVHRSPTRHKLGFRRAGRTKNRGRAQKVICFKGVIPGQPVTPGAVRRQTEEAIAWIKAERMDCDAALLLLFLAATSTIGTDDELFHQLNHWIYAIGSPQNLEEVLEVGELIVLTMRMVEEQRAPTGEERRNISEFTAKWAPRIPHIPLLDDYVNEDAAVARA
jgi:hypothetical protein